MGQGSPTSRLHGFSLIELVLVLVITAVLAAIAAPRFSQAAANQRLDAAADRVIADFDRTRARARASSQITTIAFMPGLGTYGIGGGGGDTVQVVLADEPYRTKVLSADFDSNTLVNFNAYGIPSAGGSVVLSSGGQQMTITLHANGEATR